MRQLHRGDKPPAAVNAVMLYEYDIKSQRHVLPRPAEGAIQQRINAIANYTSASAGWADWLQATGDTNLLVTVQFLDVPKPSRLSRQGRWWELEMCMSASDYADLVPGPEVTLRFVETIEAALLKCHNGLTAQPPTTLGRTKREAAWLEEGQADPGPGTDNAVRIARPPSPNARRAVLAPDPLHDLTHNRGLPPRLATGRPLHQPDANSH